MSEVSTGYGGPLSRAHCFNEDGELKEVIYGRVDDFVLPAYEPAFDFAGPTMVNLLKDFPGTLFSEADPEWYGRVRDNVERVVGFLEDRGIVVHRPREHTETELADFALSSRLNMNLYSRDSLVTLGETLVETSFLTPERNRNKYAVRYVSMELLRNGTRVLSVPQSLDTYVHDMDEEPLIEGGDIEIDGGHIYIGNSGQASNHLGYLWLKANYPEFDVHEVQIISERFPHQHLDCVMVMFSTWGCALFDDIVGGFDGLPDPLKRKRWIELMPEEAEAKLGNFIAINPEEVIMATEAERLRFEVEQLGIRVHHFPYFEVGKIGGSFRCNTCPIYREG